jgi:hypothetical protein
MKETFGNVSFYETMSEKILFILLKSFHFADNEAYCGQVPLKIYNCVKQRWGKCGTYCSTPEMKQK